MRTFFDIVGQTLSTLWAHKLRSFLTMFGIAWGVGSLLLLIGLGEGFRSGNVRQLNQIGQDIMFVFNARVPAQGGSTGGARPYWLTYQDWQDIDREVKSIRASAPVVQRGDIRAVSDYGNTNGQVFGIKPAYNKIRFLPMGGGRWINDDDEAQKRNVAVIGYEMRKNMFPGRPALGASILLNGVQFQVIGFLDTTGKDEGNATNQRVFIPYNTMQQYFPLKGEFLPTNAVSFINYQPVTRETHDTAREDVRRIIARNHGFDYKQDDAFEDWDTIKSAEMVGGIFDAMNMFLGSVGLVTLGLGAIGIINIMLVAVSERTREIGLRKALGATNRSIMMQFFLEGAFLTTLSGGIGIAAAAGFMAALGTLPSPPGFDTPQLVPWSAALSMISLSLAGIIAGIYPARKAALLEPVEALRKE
ncbi:MAG TPA: ABC transporter permease [Terriglobales bacterium]|nr:ABC transporter permease [Terriglobales bacterium]